MGVGDDLILFGSTEIRFVALLKFWVSQFKQYMGKLQSIRREAT